METRGVIRIPAEFYRPATTPEPPVYVLYINENEAAAISVGRLPERVQQEVQAMYEWSLEDVGKERGTNA